MIVRDSGPIGPTFAYSERLHREKYRLEGESFREAMNRVASALADDSEHYHDFRECLLRMRFMPGGRIQAAVGATRRTTPYNCFVSGTIADSFVDGEGHIMQRATEAACTMRLGGGIGYDFSTLRPRGAMIKKLGSKSTGPIAFMHIFNGLGDCTASVGDRRGAQMGVLRVDHPDISEFIFAKQNVDQLNRFNISIAVTDEFMEAVAADKPFDLRWGGQTHATIDARELWESVMRSTWDWAEPGVLFIDRINEMNNLWYCEQIAATNPCGEQPLPPFAACLLGSFNLSRYVYPLATGNGGEVKFDFDWDQYGYDIKAVVRAMDNIVDTAVYPLPQQEREAKNKRRMGLGVCGLANAVERLGYPYGSKGFVEFQERIHRFHTDNCYAASVELAREKGPFKLFDAEKYCQSKFLAQAVDPDIVADIRKYGIRNSHLTSIAPTGTISQCADNTTSGIEPVFDYRVERAVILDNGPNIVVIPDYGVERLHHAGKRARDVSVQEHLDVLLCAQRFTDSAVSKTCNVPPDTPWEAFKAIYVNAWEGGAKGCTTYQINSKRGAVIKEAYNKEPDPTEEACRYDPTTGSRTCGD